MFFLFCFCCFSYFFCCDFNRCSIFCNNLVNNFLSSSLSFFSFECFIFRS